MTQFSGSPADGANPLMAHEREDLGAKIHVVMERQERERHARDLSPDGQAMAPMLGGRVTSPADPGHRPPVMG